MTLKPVVLPYTKGGLKGIQVNLSDMAIRASGGIASRASGFLGSIRNTIDSTMTFRSALMMQKARDDAVEMMATPEPTQPNENAASVDDDDGSDDEDVEYNETTPAPSFSVPETLNLLNPRKQRLDFTLQEGVVSSSYLSALSAHTSYWTDLDAATFILKEIYELS